MRLIAKIFLLYPVPPQEISNRHPLLALYLQILNINVSIACKKMKERLAIRSKRARRL